MNRLSVAPLFASFALAASVPSAGCTGSEVGNPSVALTAWTTDDGTAVVGTSQGGAAIEEAWLAVEDMRFAPVEGSHPDVVLVEPPAVSLVGGARTVRFEPSVDAYGEVHVHFAPATDLAEGAPPELARSTFVVTGRRADGAAFRIVGGSNLGVELLPEPGTAIHVVERQQFLLAFDLAAWFGPIAAELDALPVPADGVIAVDADNHPEVLAPFGDALAAAASLHADEDGSGTIGPTERSPIARPAL